MTNARKKAKQIKKAKARKDKAKALRHRKSLGKKDETTDGGADGDGPVPDKQGPKGSFKQASAKPASMAQPKIHRTQGK